MEQKNQRRKKTKKLRRKKKIGRKVTKEISKISFQKIKGIKISKHIRHLNKHIDHLKELKLQLKSKKRQIISVTHLPQIASKANTHFKVFKSERNNRTTSEIKRLEQSERVEEIAKMLSGKTVTETSINNAMELLSQ